MTSTTNANRPSSSFDGPALDRYAVDIIDAYRTDLA